MERATQHPLYRRWRGAIERCERVNCRNFPRYGARGIRVCERWRNSFDAFVADIGDPPGPGYSIDRIDNDGHYEPGNVRWATATQQQRNKKNKRLLTAFGRTQHVFEWSREARLPLRTLMSRLDKGWTAEDAISRPVETKRLPPITFNGVTRTPNEWDEERGFRIGLIAQRLSLGWSPEEAVSRPANSHYRPPVTVDGVTRTHQEWEAIRGFRPGLIAQRLRHGWTPEDAVNRPVAACGIRHHRADQSKEAA